MKNVSVIIPYFNEGDRVFSVLEAIERSDLVKEIILVNDGSNESCDSILNDLSKRIAVIRHKKNMGKSEAMRTGLKRATGKIVVFVDADLQNFTKIHLKKLVEPIIKNDYEMTIGVRERDVFYARYFSVSIPFGGERAFNRSELLKNIDMFNCGGYLIEAEFNRHYFRKNKTCLIFLKNVSQVAKFEKEGLCGIGKSLSMSKRIIGHIGVREYLYQVLAVKRMKLV